MTITDFDAAVDQALLISYDWEPACESKNCRVGHPAATHILIYTTRTCGCCPPSMLICPACVERITNHPDSPAWRCKDCGGAFFGYKAEYMRIEPLP